MKVGQRLKTFQQRLGGRGVLNSVSHWGKAYLNHKEMPQGTPHPARVHMESLQIPSGSEYVEQLEASCLTGGHTKWCCCWGKQLASSLRSYTYICLTYGPAIGLLGIYPRVKKAYAHSEALYMSVHWSFICESPELEITTTTKNVQNRMGNK